MFKKIHTFRIKPNKQLATEILNYCQLKGISSGVILSMLGSLKEAQLGFLKELPGKYITKSYEGPLEFVTAAGTIALKDDELLLHIHAVISTDQQTNSGHLVEGIVFSTIEVIIGELQEQIEREYDPYTGLNELKM